MGTLLSPLLEQIDSEPREFSGLVDQLIIEAENRGDAATFWPLWSMIATRVRRARWLSSLERRSYGSELIRSVFLNGPWRQGLREWRLLGANHRHVDDLFSSLPVVDAVLESYLRYLLSIGKPSLPNAVGVVDRRFGAGLAGLLVASKSAREALDQLVSRLMFEELPALQRAPLRDAMLRLLEALIHAGSSNAFLLREDFLTPSSGAVR